MAERHEKLIRALQLVQRLASSRTGLTMNELCEGFAVGRRTMERMLRAVDQACDGLEAIPGDNGEKRWRLAPSILNRTTALNGDEMAELDHAVRRLERDGLGERAAILRGAAEKLRVVSDRRTLHRAELDAEAILQHEGLATRPGPRVRVGERLIAALRRAVLGNRRLHLLYRGANGLEQERVVEPVGLLYGHRPYLLAAVPGKADAAVWRLDRILAATVAEERFAPRFDLRAVTADSFGIWREAPVDVVLRFDAAVAAEAANWCFHPSQSTERQADGTLLVRFRAGGVDEMAHHFATWGEVVEIVEPPALRERLLRMAETLHRRHAASGPDGAGAQVADREEREAATT